MKQYLSIIMSLMLILSGITVDAEENMGIEFFGLNFYEEDHWESISSMKNPRAEGYVCVIGGELYVVGGIGSNGHMNTIEKYNDSQGEWKNVTTIPGTVKGFSVANDASKIYIIGGYEGSWYLNRVRVYDTLTDKWSTLKSMKKERDRAAAVYVDNRIYVLGGRNEEGIVESCEYYDFNRDEWSVFTNCNQSTIRIGARAHVINDYICLYGGIDKNYSDAGVVMYKSGEWLNGDTVVDAGSEGISIAWGKDKALIFTWDKTRRLFDVHEMSVENGTISINDIMIENSPHAGKYSEYVMCNGYLYAIGGYNLATKEYLSSVDKYSVYYGEYANGKGEINNVITENGNSITFNAETGQEYMLFINVKDIRTNLYIYEIEFQDDCFSVIDGCALTVENDTTVELVEDTDIAITEIHPGGISFICDEEFYGVKTTKTLNAILLKANSSGQRTITYSMVGREE